MRAEDTLQYMADFYPDLFPTRKRALEHLFCVIGNGYEWENGELVETCDSRMNRYNLKEPVERAIFEHDDDWKDFSFEIRKKIYESRHPNNLKVIFDNSSFRSIRVYNKDENKSLYLYNYPEDIKPDWKTLIEECKEYIRKEGLEV